MNFTIITAVFFMLVGFEIVLYQHQSGNRLVDYIVATKSCAVCNSVFSCILTGMNSRIRQLYVCVCVCRI